MNVLPNEETVTFDEAMSFIAGYCDWNPLPNENAAARRLIEAGITGEDLDRMGPSQQRYIARHEVGFYTQWPGLRARSMKPREVSVRLTKVFAAT